MYGVAQWNKSKGQAGQYRNVPLPSGDCVKCLVVSGGLTGVRLCILKGGSFSASVETVLRGNRPLRYYTTRILFSFVRKFVLKQGGC